MTYIIRIHTGESRLVKVVANSEAEALEKAENWESEKIPNSEECETNYEVVGKPEPDFREVIIGYFESRCEAPDPFYNLMKKTDEKTLLDWFVETMDLVSELKEKEQEIVLEAYREYHE